MSEVDLETLVGDVALAFAAADALRPVAVTKKGRIYQPGIGPHNENAAITLMLEQLRTNAPYDGLPIGQFVAYPQLPRQKCDLWMGDPLEWVVEVKMARFVGDNGKPDDMAVKDLLSPYAADHSAVSDCTKLLSSGFDCRKAILIYGFENTVRPLEKALRAFEILAADSVDLGPRHESSFPGLVHPAHADGRVCAWEIN